MDGLQVVTSAVSTLPGAASVYLFLTEGLSTQWPMYVAEGSKATIGTVSVFPHPSCYRGHQINVILLYYLLGQGKLLCKMNTFTDFIQCTEYLIEQRYSCSDKIAIEGASAVLIVVDVYIVVGLSCVLFLLSEFCVGILGRALDGCRYSHETRPL